MIPFSADHFARPTVAVAQDLLGTVLVHTEAGHMRQAGRIVETEAYTQDDPAFHGWGLYDEATGTLQKEGRGIALFGAPGTAYVYLIYGLHWLLNVVTEPEGTGGAVLIRAVEPVAGEGVMQQRRAAARRRQDLTNGPGKLTEAFGIDDAFHGTMLTGPPLFFAAPEEPRSFDVATSSRIGISKGVERPWRFFIDGHPYVSPATPSDQA